MSLNQTLPLLVRVTICSGLALSSCEKDVPTEPAEPTEEVNCSYYTSTYTEISEDLTPFRAGIGSYWIMQDSATGTLDSAYVYDKVEGAYLTSAYGGGCGYDFEFDRVERLMIARFPSADTIARAYYRNQICRLNRDWIEDPPELYDYGPPRYIIFHSDTETVDSLIVGGVMFASAFVKQADFMIGNSNHWDAWEGSTFYLVPGVGVIKEVLIDSVGDRRVNELIRYHIE